MLIENLDLIFKKKCLESVLIGCFLIIGYYWLRPWLRAVKLVLNLPGPKPVPLLGNVNIIQSTENAKYIATNAYKLYGPVGGGWVTIIPFVGILEPKYLQHVMGSSKQADKNFFYCLLHTFLGRGLVTNNGQKWKTHRKYIQPHFHTNILEFHIKSFVEGAEILVQQLEGRKEVKITESINQCLFAILHETILGIPLKEKRLKALSPFNKGHVVLTDRIVRPWLLFDFAYKLTLRAKHEVEQKFTLHDFVRKILKERKESLKRKEMQEWCLLEDFINISETNPDFTDNDIVNEISTFMLAGQDTVGGATSFTLYFLAKHQDVQEKVMEELKTIFEENPQIDTNSLNAMKYLEQCIKESLRLCPSVPIMAKRLTEDVKIDDYVLPAGLNVLICPYSTHRLPHYYPNPEVYDPERFSTTNLEKRNPFAFIPFSAGPRNCIGMKFAMLEMKTIIATLLRSYKISLKPGCELELFFRVTLRAKGGIWLQLEPRN